MSTVLIVLGVLVALIGALFASSVTGGVAAIGFACFLAILARIAQAQAHHRELMARMETPPKAADTA